jgi:phosphoglycolate phosphatase-like HAD superfamily hydrolase
MTTPHEGNFREIVDPQTVATRFLAGSGIELIDGFSVPPPPRHALFDFDGTLSLIREGWPEIMIPMMVELLEATGSGESREQLSRITTGFVMELNGKQTIYQMIRLAEEIERRGGNPLEPLAYKEEYHARLMARIQSRRDALRAGSIPAEEMLVPGSLAILSQLQSRGLTLYLASGTDENYVKEEVELLGLDRFFGERVFGAKEDFRSFSKAQVIARILEQNAVPGASLVGFGDGYVEIQNVREVGGTAVAVASDESRRSGRPDAWKRDRLIGAGANIVIPDFQDADRLLGFLMDGLKE